MDRIEPMLVYGTVTQTYDDLYVVYGGKIVHCTQHMPEVGDITKFWKTGAGQFHVSLHKDLKMMSETQAWRSKLLLKVRWVATIGFLATVLWSIS